LYIYNITLLEESKPKPYKNNYINNPDKNTNNIFDPNEENN